MTLCVLLCTLVCAAYAQKKITGQCGEKVTYTIDLKAKKLTLKGKGTIQNYPKKTPWVAYGNEITILEIDGDVEGLTGKLCRNLPALKEIVVTKSTKYYAEGNCLLTTNDVVCVGCATSVIPEKAKAIAGEAFAGCVSLTSISIPSSVLGIGGEAFRGCTSLSEVTMLPSLEFIAGGAFYECKALKSIEIPSSVTSIGVGAFAYCSALSKISIPSSVCYVGASAFYECGSLPVVEHVRYADKWAVDLDDLNQASYTLREGTVGIVNGLFSGCPNLTDVTIPAGVSVIGESIFEECPSLRKLSMGDMPSNVADKAFAGIDCMHTEVTGLSCQFLSQHGASAPVDSLIAWGGIKKDKGGRVYDIVEQNASFPGGEEVCAMWIKQHLQYPAACKANGVGGRVMVSFVVELDGSLSDAKIVRSPAQELSDEVLRLIGQMPKWRPAILGNKIVRSHFNLPIIFRL